VNSGLDRRVGQWGNFMKVPGWLPSSYMQNPHNVMH
jgi:hypothetical protein